MQFRNRISSKNVSRVNLANSKAKKLYGTVADTSPESFNFSMLNEVLYKGRQDRQQRYLVYDQMDSDVDIYRALDIIAEHCTQKDEKSETPFKIFLDDGELGQEDSEVIFDMMKIWNKLNGWDNMAFRAIRNTIKYGDTFFIRDENYKLHPLHPASVDGCYTDEDTGEIQAYKVSGLKRRFKCLVNCQQDAVNVPSSYQRGSSFQSSSGHVKTYNGLISPSNIVHLSLNEGLDVGGNGGSDIWPFGESFLESIFKDFKCRSLLEDAEIIHRLQRAPARRIFYVSVGKQRADKAESFMRRFKNEIQQKRIPSNFGGKESVDTIYNPISQMEDLFIPVGEDGKGSRVENLEGQAWSNPEILQYFNSKMLRGLRVPTSFMLGPEEGGAVFNDGRTGTAYMQEQQFSKSCERVQNLVDNTFDFEFKMFLKYRSVDVHNGYFDVKFVPPMNFNEHRQRALYDERLQTLGSALSNPFFAKRFALKKFGFFTDDEILENEHMWMEENLGPAARQYNQDNNLGGMGVGMGSFDNSFGAAGMGMPGEMGDPSMGGMGAGMDQGMGTQPGMGGGAMGAAPGGAMGGGMGMEGVTPAMIKNMLNENPEFKKSLLEAIYNGGKYPMLPSKAPTVKQLVEDVLDEIESDSDQENERAPLAKENKDEGWAKKREENSKDPVMALAHIRKLRILRDKNRKEMVKRMLLLKQMYAQPPAGNGMF